MVNKNEKKYSWKTGSFSETYLCKAGHHCSCQIIVPNLILMLIILVLMFLVNNADDDNDADNNVDADADNEDKDCLPWPRGQLLETAAAKD